MIRQIRALGALCACLALSAQANATIVRFQMADGSRFDVNLYDKRTPATVANFLAYVNAGTYTNVVFHRSVSGFVVQGGGFTYPGTLPFNTVTERPAVTNEPVLSNVRGTIAMAKLSGGVNSATSQWFINMGNNSANLDVQNGGFTVFGEVTSGGMTVLDAINALPTFVSSPLDSLPLRNYTVADANNGVAISANNVVYATSVTVIDSNADSASALTPAANTLLSASSGGTNTATSDSGGGGAPAARAQGSLTASSHAGAAGSSASVTSSARDARGRTSTAMPSTL